MSNKAARITDSFKKKKVPVTNGKSEKGSASSSSSDNVDPIEENNMKILKQFDLNWEYGPSMGITRLERWNRAEKHGLNPSLEVKQLITTHSGNEKYTKCLWNDYKNVI